MSATLAGVVIMAAIGLFIIITAVCWSTAEEKELRDQHHKRQADLERYGPDVALRHSKEKHEQHR